MRSCTQHAALLAAFTLALPVVAGAQTARPASASANAQAMQQLQQLASERTALQAENARLKAELEGARKERDSLKSAQEASARRSRGTEADLAAAQGDKARLEGELAEQKQRLQELVQRYRETAETMKQVETDRAAKTQQLSQREQELKTCVDDNHKLYTLGTEVIDKLEHQGFWSAVAQREPFTQLKRTQLENLADGYRGTAQDNLLPQSTGTNP